MKKMLLLSLTLCSILFISSCSKRDVIGPTREGIEGSWVLTESSRSDGYNWVYFNSGMENGVFDFYRNGDAEFDNGYDRMRGQWNIRVLSSGYYDQFGQYRNEMHQTFEMHAYDPYTKGSIDLVFDDIVIHANSIIATNFDGRYVVRYFFKRY